MNAVNEKEYVIPSRRLYEFIADVLHSAGLQEDEAAVVARGIWLSNLRGIDSHGVRLLPHYLSALKNGRINATPTMKLTRTNSATAILDADHGFGHLAGILAMNHCRNLAKETGIGAVVVRNSNHNGMLAYYALEAASQDMIGIAMTHTTPRMATPNGKKPFFGTNPICFAAPLLNEPPLCFDGATTLMTGNTLCQYKEQNQTLPKNTAVSKDGVVTTDPSLAALLVGIGGYKGFGIAMFVDIFSGLLACMPAANDVSNMNGSDMRQKRRLGHFFAVLDIAAFLQPDRFKTELQNVVDRIRAETPLDASQPVQVPGDPEKRAARIRQRSGIALPHHLVQTLNSIATELQLQPLN